MASAQPPAAPSNGGATASGAGSTPDSNGASAAAHASATPVQDAMRRKLEEALQPHRQAAMLAHGYQPPSAVCDAPCTLPPAKRSSATEEVNVITKAFFCLQPGDNRRVQPACGACGLPNVSWRQR
jgi:hypothetical protein